MSLFLGVWAGTGYMGLWTAGEDNLYPVIVSSACLALFSLAVHRVMCHPPKEVTQPRIDPLGGVTHQNNGRQEAVPRPCKDKEIQGEFTLIGGNSSEVTQRFINDITGNKPQTYTTEVLFENFGNWCIEYEGKETFKTLCEFREGLFGTGITPDNDYEFTIPGDEKIDKPRYEVRDTYLW